jgi:hypothetical protein
VVRVKRIFCVLLVVVVAVHNVLNSVDSVYLFFNGISSVATLFSGGMKYGKQQQEKKCM